MAYDLKEVVSLIKSGEWLHNLCFITADVNKKEAGKVIVLQRCRIARRELMIKRDSPVIGNTGKSKPANHNANFTVNLELPNHQIRKVHPALIFSINNVKVV